MTDFTRARPWLDEEYAFLEDHRNLSNRQAGEALGRSERAVERKRQKLNRGWEPQREHWTESDIEFVRTSQSMTSAQVADALGTTQARVENQRKRLNLREGIHFTSEASKSPWSVGARQLLAKTCLGCGFLLDSRRFHFSKSKGGYWTPRCNRCNRRDTDRSKYAGRYGNTSRASKQRMQAVTLPRSARSHEPWTEADHRTLEDPSLTILEKALRLERTYYATAHMTSEHGYRSKVGTAELDGLWVIEFLGTERAA